MEQKNILETLGDVNNLNSDLNLANPIAKKNSKFLIIQDVFKKREVETLVNPPKGKHFYFISLLEERVRRHKFYFLV